MTSDLIVSAISAGICVMTLLAFNTQNAEA